MDEKNKKAYLTPIVVALGLEARGSGLCAGGSGDTVSCRNGPSVTLPDVGCHPGTAAGIECGSGLEASGYFCSGGSYFNP